MEKKKGSNNPDKRYRRKAPVIILWDLLVSWRMARRGRRGKGRGENAAKAGPGLTYPHPSHPSRLPVRYAPLPKRQSPSTVIFSRRYFTLHLGRVDMAIIRLRRLKSVLHPDLK